MRFLFLFVSNWIFTNCHSRSNINCKSHHNKPATSGTNRNTAPTASVPSSNGSVPTTKWPRPDSTDHCTITKRCYYTGSDSHSTGSSRSRPTTGMSTDNGTANVEWSIPSFFGGMNQIRELILWSTYRLNRSVVYPYFPTPRDFSNPLFLEQNLSIYQSNLNWLQVSRQTLILSPPQPRFSNLPRIWTNFLFPVRFKMNRIPWNLI